MSNRNFKTEDQKFSIENEVCQDPQSAIGGKLTKENK